MAKPTGEEVAQEIFTLNTLCNAMPRALRNLMIVIETLTERPTVDQVYEMYDTEDNEFQYALDAAMWLSGETDTKPSEGWA
jgi:hypothetical protein